MANGTPLRPNRIDSKTADRARAKIKTAFKGNGGLPDLSDDELLVLFADVASELNERRESTPQSGAPRVPGLRHLSRRILA